jgi:hypothetical protein
MKNLTWRQGMISNPGGLSLIEGDGWAIAHVWQGNNRLWSACTDDGAVLVQNVPKSESIRIAYETAQGVTP